MCIRDRPVIFDETRSRFLIEISSIEYSELQIMTGASEKYIDFSELKTIAGINKTSIDELFENHFCAKSETTLELRIAEIKILFFLLSVKEIRKSSTTLPFQENKLLNFTRSLGKFWSVIRDE